MLWRNPTYFWFFTAVVVAAVLLVLAWRRRTRLLQVFADASLVSRLTPDVDARRRLLRLVLRVLALAALVLALAGPKWGFRWQEVRREGIDMIVAIDTSRSMLATDVKPNRLERAKLAVLDLLKLLEGDRIGLVAFAGTAFLECPLTLDYAAFERSLRAIEVGIIPRGGTALARAIDTSLEAFEARQGKYEALILITDGEDHEGDVEDAAKRAAERGVKIYTVGIGTSEGELLPQQQGGSGFIKDRKGQVVKSRLNEDTLEKIAVATGGAYVRGAGASLGLDEVFRDHIAKMERREVASTLERQYEERFQIPLALAVLLLLGEALLGERKVAGVARRWRLRRLGSDNTSAERTGDVRPRAVSPATSRTLVSLLILALAPTLVGWFDPTNDRAVEGNRLYASGKYDEAAAMYGEGLVDAPESPLLQFNRSTALYKQGKYDEAIAGLNKVVATGDNEWVALAAYNLGNSYHELGSKAADADLKAAIASYEQALAAYKRAMAADPTDDAPKFNHELTAHQIEVLKKKLEEQQKEQEEKQQQQEQQQQDQQQQEQQQQGEQQEEQQQQQEPQPQEGQQEEQAGQQEPQPEEQQQQEAKQQPKDDAGEQQANQQPEPEQGKQQQAQPGSGTTVGGEDKQDMEKQAANAVLDVARDEELGPEDIQRDVGVAGVGEAAQDW